MYGFFLGQLAKVLGALMPKDAPKDKAAVITVSSELLIKKKPKYVDCYDVSAAC